MNQMINEQSNDERTLNERRTFEQWTNNEQTLALAWSATSSNKNTTINLFEGEGGDDVNGNSNVAITADSKVCERRRYNELETIAAEEGERKPTISM